VGFVVPIPTLPPAGYIKMSYNVSPPEPSLAAYIHVSPEVAFTPIYNPRSPPWSACIKWNEPASL